MHLLSCLCMCQPKDTRKRMTLGLVGHDLQFIDHIGHVGQTVSTKVDERGAAWPLSHSGMVVFR